MRRTPLANAIHRALSIARHCETRRISTSDGIALARELDQREQRTRREWLRMVGQAGVAGAVASLATPAGRVFAAAQGASPSVGIVGAGLAGLACADALASRGIAATVYEAANRVGGRCYSLRGFFPGQVAELGGELIDNPHKTMLGYARRFGLAVEDVVKKSGDVTFGVSTDVAQAATGPRRGQAPRRVAHPLHAGRDTCIAGLVQQRAAASSTRTRSAVR